nr:phage tail tape measure protein [Enterococcus larvae]
MEKDAKKLRQELKLESEQLKLSGTETEKLTSKLSNLEKQYELAQAKTEASRKALEDTKRLFGDNSEAVSKMETQLRNAEIAEQKLANQIATTSSKLEEAKRAESDRVQQLDSLKSNQEALVSSSEKLTKEYELQKAALGNNATEAQKAKLEQQHLADQMRNSAEQVANLEQQLELAKQEFGENSDEVNRLESELLDAQLASQQFSNEYATATDSLGNFSNKAKEVSDGLMSFGKSYTAKVSAPIVGAAALSVKAASDFESAFAGVKKTVDEVVDSNGKAVISYDDLSDGIRDMAKNLPATAAEISEVAESAGQLGIKTENVLSFSKTMINLGESTNMSADEAATALARLANITGMSQDDFDKLGATIVDLGNNFATTEADITSMGLRLAGAGKQVGMSEAEIMSFAAALSSVGIEAEAGGSAFSKVMINMQLATETGVGAFDELKNSASNAGMSWETVSKAIRVGGKELTAVSGKMGLTSSELKTMVKEADKTTNSLDDFADVAGMTGEEFARAFKEDASGAISLFIQGLASAEDRGISTIKMLDDMGITEVRLRDSLLRAAGASDVFNEALATGTEAWDENTALTDEASKRYETFESKVAMVKNQITDLAIEFGGPLMDALVDMLDALKPVFEVLGNLAKAFSEADPEMQKMIMTIGAIIVAVGPIAMVLAKVIETIAWIAGLFAQGGAISVMATWITTTLVPALGSIAAVVFTWPVLIAAAIAAVAFIVYKYWDEIVAFTSKAFEIVSKFFSDGWDTVKKVTSEKWGELTKWVSDSWNGMTKAVSEMWDSFLKGISDALSATGKFFSDVWESIKQTASNVWTSIVETVRPIIDQFVRIIMVPISFIQTVLEGTWLLIKAGAIIAWEAIKIAAQWTWEQIKNYIITPISDVYNFVLGKMSELGIWLSSKWEEIKVFAGEAWQGIVTNVITPIQNMYNSAVEWFSAILEIVVQWLSGVWQSVVEWFTKIKDATGEIWDGIKQWIVSKFNEAKDGVTSAAASIWDNLSTTFSNVVTTIQEKFNQAKDFIVTPINDARDTLKQTIADIVGFFKDIKLPHFGLKTSTKTILGKEITYPSGIDVKWNADGALFKRPVVAGMYGGQAQGFGEAGPEAAIPLRKNVLAQIGEAIMASIGNEAIMTPVLDGLVNAAQNQMNNQSQKTNETSINQQLINTLNQFMEVIASQPQGQVQMTVNNGSVHTNSMSEYDQYNRDMERAYKAASAGLRGNLK